MPDAAVAEPKPAHPLVVLNTYLTDRVDSLRNALPPHIKPDRFISSVMTAVQLNPDLMACDRRSLWLSCMRCAQDGLLPDGQEAAIVPYKQKASYLPMYQGLLKKFRNSGQFKWVTANLVYEGETFEHWITQDGEHFKHIPADDNTGKKVRRVYALATTKDGGSFIADLSLADIKKRQNMSRASRDDAPWKQWPDEMMKKTAIRVLSKLLPKSSDLDAFLQTDEQESLGVEAKESIADQRGAAFGNVLDHFAESAGEGTDAARAEVHAPAGEGEPQDAASAKPNSAANAAPAASLELQGLLENAWRRGQEAKAAGHSRKAVPPEYRSDDRGREGLAWIAGFDGGPKPVN